MLVLQGVVAAMRDAAAASIPGAVYVDVNPFHQGLLSALRSYAP